MKENFEELSNIRQVELNKELVIKYEKLGFLENIKESDKLELSNLYEDFTNFITKLDEKDSVVGSRFRTLFIPIIKKLYCEFKETNFVMVYELYKIWYSEDGIKDSYSKTDISDEALKSDDYNFNGFINHYKSIKIYTDDKLLNDIFESTIYDGKNNSCIAKPEYKVKMLTRTLNYENKCGEEIKEILSEATMLLNYENCYVTMLAIGKLNGEVFVVNETNDSYVQLNQYLIDGKTIVLYSGEIKNSKIIYRYSLINTKDGN